MRVFMFNFQRFNAIFIRIKKSNINFCPGKDLIKILFTVLLDVQQNNKSLSSQKQTSFLHNKGRKKVLKV